jgi:signal transduction histidine kinase/DNA-binding response OmpR family regulator
MKKSKAFFYLLYCVLISCFITGPVNIWSQDNPKGLPFITNYRYQDYNAGGVNWWAEEDSMGVLYFANANGIIIYDGQRWELVRPPGNDETRSLAKGKDGKIYVSTNGDIGYLTPGKKGKPEFVSLKNKIPEKHRVFAEVWETHEFDGKIFYRTNNKIFIWDGQTIKVLESREGFHVGDVVQGNYYCRIWTRGLCVLKNDSFYVVPNGEKFANERIYAMLPYDDTRMLIGTRTQGLFIYDGKDFTPFKTEADPFIFNTSLYGGLVLSNGYFAINTFNNGMVIIDRSGKLVQRFDKSVGLQDNSVDHVFEDSRGNLWLSLFNGIAKFDLRSSLTYYNETFGLPAKTVFVVGSFNDTIYAGTNNGVFMLNKSTGRFQQVAGTSGQVAYFIKNGKDYLVSGAEKGLLKLTGGKAVPVIPGINYDFHLQLLLRSKVDTTLFYASLRSGLALIRYTSATGTYQVESFRDDLFSSNGRFHETKQGYLWIEGDNSGELKLVKPKKINDKLSLPEAEVEVFNYNQGLPRKYVVITDFDNKLYFASDNDSVFTFSEKENRFFRDTSAYIKKYIDINSDATSYPATDQWGRIWASLGTGVFVKIPSTDGSLKFIDAPFRELGRNYPVWNIEPTVDKNGNPVVWFTGREGIIRYDGNLDETAGGAFRTIIRGIHLNEDSVFYSGFQLLTDHVSFSHKWNTVRFQFSAPFFKMENETLFSTWLEGRDKSWSEWNKQNYREFGNLPAGTYTFRVKAKNIYDTESQEASYSFIVLPPWYATWWAYLLYAFAAAAAIYTIVRWRTRQLHEKHRELEKLVEQRTHELSHRVEELAVINSVQEGLVRQLDIDAVYELVGEKIRQIFNAQVIDIVTYDRKNNLLEDRYSYEKGDRTLVGKWEPFGFRKHVIDTGQYLLINENLAQKSVEFNSRVIHGEQPKSAIWMPLITGNEVTGMISLQDLDKEHAFTDSHISLLTTLANSMSVALESAKRFDETNRLLKETEQRTAELAVINSVQEGLAKELDMQGIYNLVGERLCTLFPDTQTLVIRTFDYDKGLEHFQYAIEKGVRLEIDPRPFMWANKILIETKKPLDIRENYVETAHRHGGSGVTKGQPPKSAVFVPMMVGDVVKGSVSLQNVDKEFAFNDSDLRLLTTITNSMSVALENARLFDETNRLLKETEQRTAELAVINSVQEGLVREMNMQAIYDLVGNRICELFDTQTVLIRTFDNRTETEHWQYVIEKGQRLYSNPRPLIWANKLLIQTKQPLLINNNYLETARKYGGTGVSKGLPPKSALFVPMIVGDVVRGSVSLQNVEKENAFTESDLRLLTTLTNSMSVALENARLFDETNRLLGEAKQRANELSTVNHISQGLASQLNMDELIKLVGEQLRQLFKANIVYLAILDPKTKIIHFPYQYGDNMAPLHLGEGLTSKIILQGEPLLINKDLQELRTQMGIQPIGIPAASYLGVPIPVGDEVIGVLSVQSTEHENRFNDDDLRLLSTIAASVGVALRKAKLFEEVQVAKTEAEAARKAAEKANDAKSAFLSTVSHELRTPLTSVLGFAKIIKKRLDEKIFPVTDTSDPKTEKTIQQISENLKVVVSEGERLTHLINDVLDLAKIEAGKMEWNMETVSMPEIAERAIAATTALFENKNLVLEKNIESKVPDITGDRDKLIQVMVNLISNSVKFTPKGKVTCRVFQKDDEIIASITDTGIGIAPDDHAAVFEQFRQVGDTLTDKPKGTGLGLPICKEIIEHHGGRIWLDSELGKGSIFSIALPVKKTIAPKPLHLDDLVKRLKEQVVQSQLSINGKIARVLVVDDDDSIRSLLQQELGDAGYLIEEASNGKEALAKVRANRPDLIILDIMMPEMNGFDVAAVLKNDPQTMDIPIIVLSIVQDKARGFRIGVDRYLTKPIDTGILFNEIGSLLEQGKSKKKVMIVDEDSATVNTLTDVLKTKGYAVTESNGKELVEKAVANQPDIIIINSLLSGKQDIVQTLRFEKGLENVLFLVYQ